MRSSECNVCFEYFIHLFVNLSQARRTRDIYSKRVLNSTAFSISVKNIEAKIRFIVKVKATFLFDRCITMCSEHNILKIRF